MSGSAAAAASAPESRSVALAKRARRERSDRLGRRRRQFALIALALLLIGVVLAHVWVRLRVVHTGYVLATASKLNQKLEQENRELKLEWATMATAERLEAAARKRLGMTMPEKGQVIPLP